jgi:hypothetical protein
MYQRRLNSFRGVALVYSPIFDRPGTGGASACAKQTAASACLPDLPETGAGAPMRRAVVAVI